MSSSPPRFEINLKKGSLIGRYVFASTPRVTFTIPKAFRHSFFDKSEVTEVAAWEDPVNPELVQLTVDLGEKYERCSLIVPKFFPKVDSSKFIKYKWMQGSALYQECDYTRFLSQEAFEQTIGFIDFPNYFSTTYTLISQEKSGPETVIGLVDITFRDRSSEPEVSFLTPDIALMNTFENDKQEFLTKSKELINKNNVYISNWLTKHSLSYIDCILKLPEVPKVKDEDVNFVDLPWVWLKRVLEPKHITTFTVKLQPSLPLASVAEKLDERLLDVSQYAYYVKDVQFDLISVRMLLRATKVEDCHWLKKKNKDDTFHAMAGFRRVVILPIDIFDGNLPVCFLVNENRPITPADAKPPLLCPVVNIKDSNKIADHYIKTNDFSLYERRADFFVFQKFSVVITNFDEIHDVKFYSDPAYTICRAFVLEVSPFLNVDKVPVNLHSLIRFLQTETTIDGPLIKDFLDNSSLLTTKMKTFWSAIKKACSIQDSDNTLLLILQKIVKHVNLELFVVLPDEESFYNVDNQVIYLSNPSVVYFSQYEEFVGVQAFGFIQVQDASWIIDNPSTFTNKKLNERLFLKENFIDREKQQKYVLDIIAQRLKLENSDTIDNMLKYSLLWKGVQFAVSPWRKLYLENHASTIPIFQLTSPSEPATFFENPISWFTTSESLVESRPLMVYWPDNSKVMKEISLSEYNNKYQTELLGKAVIVASCLVTGTGEEIRIPQTANDWILYDFNKSPTENTVVNGHSHTQLALSGINLNKACLVLYACRFVSCGSTKNALQPKDFKQFFELNNQGFSLENLAKFKDEQAQKRTDKFTEEEQNYTKIAPKIISDSSDLLNLLEGQYNTTSDIILKHQISSKIEELYYILRSTNNTKITKSLNNIKGIFGFS